MRTRLGVAVAFAAVVLATVAGGTTITVTDTADDVAPNGNCTLREAIIAANTDSAQDACPAGNGADTIAVPAGVYLLTHTGAEEDAASTGDLDVTADVSIAGEGATATVLDGNGTDRVLDIDPGTAGITVGLAGLTIANGAGVGSGAGIRNAATLAITECTVRDNTASGTPSSPPLGFGGASGGGIASTGTLTLIRSTVSNNEAVLEIDPIVPSLGGGIVTTQATVVNSTISDNTALFGGGIATIAGNLTFSNATVAANTVSGITVFGFDTTLTFRNTIVADNVGDDCGGVDAGWITDAYNLDSDGTCQMQGSDLGGVDPLLGALQDNGGPTFTRALQSGSVALDAGDPGVPGSGGTACEATDQRGVSRPLGGRCDIGALESSATTTTTLPCAPAPRAGCQGALSTKGALKIRNKESDAQDVLTWQWTGNGVQIGSLGAPLSSSAYALCLYDAGGLRLAGLAPAGACGTPPCWRPASMGYRYFGQAPGVTTLRLQAGNGPGGAKMRATTKALSSPAFPLAIPVRVQLVRTDSPWCWEAVYSAPVLNQGPRFKARSD
jgi:CSLREA domain-containing protein